MPCRVTVKPFVTRDSFVLVAAIKTNLVCDEGAW